MHLWWVLERVLLLVHSRVLLKRGPFAPKVALSLDLHKALEAWQSQSPLDVRCHQLSCQFPGEFPRVHGLTPLKKFRK
jgi:hypothetical protein